MSDNFQPVDWDNLLVTSDCDYFDWEAYLSTNQPVFGESTSSNMDWIGQEEQNAALNFDFSLQHDVPAAPVELRNRRPCAPIGMGLPQFVSLGEHPNIAAAQPYRSISALEVYTGFKELVGQLEHNVHSENSKRNSDTPGHFPAFGSRPLSCAECNLSFPDLKRFREHAEIQQHNPFECSCGIRFSRFDALNRHCASFCKDTKKFPCTFCKRHRGNRGFTRRDHLVQHLRGYHKFDEEEIEKICPTHKFTPRQVLACPHAGCAFYRDDEFMRLLWSQQNAQRPFEKQSDYNKHLKDVHNETPFPCRVDGCERVRAKGYTRERDLIKHLTIQHPDAPQYSPMPREAPQKIEYDCIHCLKRFSNGAHLDWHIASRHQPRPRMF